MKFPITIKEVNNDPILERASTKENLVRIAFLTKFTLKSILSKVPRVDGVM